MGRESEPKMRVKSGEEGQTQGEGAAVVLSEPANEAACEVCGGTGEVAYFRGKSRFLLSRKACSACAGHGFTARPAAEGRTEGEE